METNLDYRVERLGGATELVVTNTYGGDLAASFRALHASSSEPEFAERASASIARTYKQSQRFGDTVFRDDESKNRVAVIQHFRLDACWHGDGATGPGLLVSPYWLADVLPEASPSRATPLGVPQPMTVIEDSTVTVVGGLNTAGAPTSGDESFRGPPTLPVGTGGWHWLDSVSRRPRSRA